MTIQQFIEKAEQGGYVGILLDPLDPLAWKAVGSVEGWSDDFGKKGTNLNEGIYYMHRMIDALAGGKTIEEYLSTL